MGKSKLAVLVTSCDAYRDIWDPFFLLMDKYWSDIPYKVYLNTETEQYNKSFSNFCVKSLNQIPRKNQTWSKRMKDVLEQIPEEYVFVLVEDFFLREHVQTELIEELIEQMEKNPLMCSVQLFGTRTNCDNHRINVPSPTMNMIKIVKGYAKVVFVPTIWRKSTLLKWLRPHESIWSFESSASQRAYRWKYKEECYRVFSPSIFNYLWEKGCYCVVNGKWMMHPLLTELFNSNEIKVDFSQRGTITMEEWNSVSIKTLIKRNGFGGSVKKFFLRILSLF